VQASTTYTYTVRAIGADDDSSLASNAVTIQIPALPENADSAPPSHPGSLTATAILGAGTLNYLDKSVSASATSIYTVEAIDVMGHHSPLSNAISVVRP
jgi:hypothetical protein